MHRRHTSEHHAYKRKIGDMSQERPIFGKINQGTAPFKGTQVDPADSMAEISKLLKKYGARPVQWTEEGENYQLRFGIMVEIENERREFAIQLTPPSFSRRVKTYDKKLQRYIQENVLDSRRGLRLLFFYLKSKLEAIAYGLIDAQEEFLSQIAIPQLGKTVYEVIKPALKSGEIEHALLGHEHEVKNVDEITTTVIES